MSPPDFMYSRRLYNLLTDDFVKLKCFEQLSPEVSDISANIFMEKDKWMDNLQFHILFNRISVIPG